MAKRLNSYCDTENTESISYAMKEKRAEITELEDTLGQAVSIEKDKLDHQNHCNELYAKFNQQKRKLQKTKKARMGHILEV